MKYHALRVFGALVALVGASLLIGMMVLVSKNIERIYSLDGATLMLFFIGPLAVIMAFAGTNLAINPNNQENLVPKMALVISGLSLIFSMIIFLWMAHETGERFNSKGLSMIMGLGLAFLHSGLKKAKPFNNSFQG